jgi:DNA-binding IclR family transcriptional regulator
LRFDPATGMCSLGPRIVELAATALAGLRILRIAGPHMERLSDKVNETVVLSIWDGQSPVVVRVDDSSDRLVRIDVRTGTRLPRATSAQGKVFLAFGPDANELDAPEREEIVRTRVAINSEVDDGIRAIAAPIFQEREITAAMAVVGTINSLPEEPDSKIAAHLRATAEALSAELGFLSDESTAG